MMLNDRAPDLKRHAPSRKKPIVLALVKPTHAQEMALLAIYLQVVKLWEAAAKRIADAYAADINSSGEPNPAAVAQEINRTAQQASMLMITIPVLLTNWASRVDSVMSAKWVRAVLSATKVDITHMLGPADMNAILKASAEWNAALVKDVSSEVQRRISNIVFAGFQQKTSVYDVAEEISRTTGMARRRARGIAYDQTNKLAAAVNKARQLHAGITHYRWEHSAKLHARPTHLARNGRIFPWTGPGSIPPEDQCGAPPFCGCHARSVIMPQQAEKLVSA